jgi:anti-sigma-K factor RskA
MASVVSIAAAAVVVAAVLGVNLIRADHQVTQLRSAVGTSARTAVAAALDTSGHRVVNLESADHRRLAQFVLVPNGQGYLVTSTLPRLPSTATYQLWGVVGGRSISLGLLGTSPDQATFTWAEAHKPTVLAITVEPAGGSVRPSAHMVATGTV